MKIVIISETGEFGLSSDFQLDLSQTTVKDCLGCWSCWVKTPGRCVHKDLDAFYKAYLRADKVIFFLKLSKGFVSGNLKSLFDRMIPLYLPFISYETGESMHLPRYEKYPDIEVY
ncbi:flavodoxin family protein [Proteiniclasticum sp.]|uniref:flavodoxin family protein n=1 Tax=Proteiniclasticum sp. TaxID=2053595 RepID=UPI00289A64D3|nr:flavodoxin family protein [Proteiniclasticum sp.]